MVAFFYIWAANAAPLAGIASGLCFGIATIRESHWLKLH
jgi:hypothetical protein